MEKEELKVSAEIENLDQIFDFVNHRLEGYGFSSIENTGIQIAVEEIFTNIANYAYQSGKGEATIRIEVEENPTRAVITFVDSGIPYNPLAKEDPDVTLSAEERPIGGLGIYMVKESMDDVTYQYENGSNILTIIKQQGGK